MVEEIEEHHVRISDTMGIRDIFVDAEKPGRIRPSIYAVLAVILVITIIVNIVLFIRSSQPPTVAVELPLIDVTLEGNVNEPGIYSLPEGATVFDAIYAAGGITSEGYLGELDIDEELVDGDRITIGEKPAMEIETDESAEVPFVPLTEEDLSLGREHKGRHTTNILYVGVPNVFIYMTIDPERHVIQLCHIHPDTRISTVSAFRTRIPGKDSMGMDKIKELYLYGGVEMTLDAMKRVLDYPPVDFYYVGDRDNFTKAVDIMGGVQLSVDEQTADYVGVDPGRRILNGAQAWDYVRFMQTLLREIDRFHRQKEFIKAASNRFREMDLISLTRFAKLVVFESENNFTLKAILDLANEVRKAPDWTLDSYLLPGERIRYGNHWYWEVDDDETTRIINRMIAPR